jgi:hypothetical protein
LKNGILTDVNNVYNINKLILAYKNAKQCYCQLWLSAAQSADDPQADTYAAIIRHAWGSVLA